MNIKQQKDDKKLTILVSGRIDTTTAPDLHEYMKNAIQGINELVIDFKDVDYVSSAGLRVVLFAQKMMYGQGPMTIINVNSDIMETFELTGFTEILNLNPI